MLQRDRLLCPAPSPGSLCPFVSSCSPNPTRCRCETWKRGNAPFCATVTGLLAIGPPVLPSLRIQSRAAVVLLWRRAVSLSTDGTAQGRRNFWFFSLSSFFTQRRQDRRARGGHAQVTSLQPCHRVLQPRGPEDACFTSRAN